MEVELKLTQIQQTFLNMKNFECCLKPCLKVLRKFGRDGQTDGWTGPQSCIETKLASETDI